MMKGLFLAIAVAGVFCGAARAEQFYGTSQTASEFSLSQFSQAATVEISPGFGYTKYPRWSSSLLGNPSLTLGNGPLLSRGTSLNWLAASHADAASGRSSEARRSYPSQGETKGASDFLTDLRSNSYATGEISVLYGRSTGRYGAEVKQGYFISEVGTDNFHISVGGFYEDVNGRGPRFGR